MIDFYIPSLNWGGGTETHILIYGKTINEK